MDSEETNKFIYSVYGHYITHFLTFRQMMEKKKKEYYVIC